MRQIFVGPDNETVRRLIERKKESSQVNSGPLAQSAIALGCSTVVPRHFRVIKRLAEYGFFRAGAMLIGTHAFLCYGNMLGVRWGSPERTQDIDFAHTGKSLALLLPSNLEVQTHSAIESLNMGFLPVAGLSGKAGGAYLIPNEPEFRLDFLTTLHRRKDAPFEHPQLHVTLQPLKFMEFSLESVQQAALIANDGAVIVNVPHPVRYALHKMLIFGEREGSFLSKAGKDLRQAAAILTCFKDSRAWEVEHHWRDLIERGRGWSSRAMRGLTTFDKSFPELEAKKWLGGIKPTSRQK